MRSWRNVNCDNHQKQRQHLQDAALKKETIYIIIAVFAGRVVNSFFSHPRPLFFEKWLIAHRLDYTGICLFVLFARRIYAHFLLRAFFRLGFAFRFSLETRGRGRLTRLHGVICYVSLVFQHQSVMCVCVWTVNFGSINSRNGQKPKSRTDEAVPVLR